MSKITVGFERISEAFKAMLWDKAKLHGISPIQIQILLFVTSHKSELCNVSHLAREFNLTKPTVSDAIRVLAEKDLIRKDHSAPDSRSYTIFTSPKGKDLVMEVQGFNAPLKSIIDELSANDQKALFTQLTAVIHKLNQVGVLTVQRTCLGCQFYDRKQQSHYCHFLEKNLADEEIRVDCPEFLEKAS